jgi:hypothetical protein
MLNLRNLEIEAGSEEGARPLFQKLMLYVVKLKYRNAQDIRPSPGDFGIDVLDGKLTTGTCMVWQMKYFVRGIGIAQQKQIHESFWQVVNKSKGIGFKIDVWCLCVPCSLSPNEIIWWENWSKDNSKKTRIRIERLCESDITQILMTREAEDIRKMFRLDRDLSRLDQFIEEKPIVALPPEKATEYEKSLFIRKLVFAGITETMSARCQFFNAELIKTEIHDKADAAAMDELTSLYEKIYSLWETRFNEALHARDPAAEVTAVYWAMLKSIEQLDKTILLSRRVPASFLHKQGFMHQLADICRVGWTPNFREIEK